MKKRLLVLTAALLYSLQVMAQKESRLIGEGGYVYTGGFLNPLDTSTSFYTPGAYDTTAEEWIPNQIVRGAYDMGNYFFTTRTTNTFNALQQVSERLDEEYDTSASLWLLRSKDIFTYNTQGLVATTEGQFYNNGTWSTQIKFTYTYNGAGDLLTRLTEYDQGSGLALYGQLINSYNTGGQIDTSTYYLWDGGTMTWDPSQRITYHYNTPKPIAQVIAQFASGNWTEVDSVLYTLDANYNILEQLRRVLQAGTWRDFTKLINTFDANNNMLTSIAQFPQSGVFVNFNQTTNTYNTFNQPTQTTVQSWDATTNSFTWQNGNTQRIFTFEIVPTGIKTAVTPNDAVHVYPIPASNTLTLDLNETNMKHASIVLFDLTGKIAGHWNASTATQPEQTLDISNIPAGIYLLKVVSDKGIVSRQVSIIR